MANAEQSTRFQHAISARDESNKRFTKRASTCPVACDTCFRAGCALCCASLSSQPPDTGVIDESSRRENAFFSEMKLILPGNFHQRRDVDDESCCKLKGRKKTFSTESLLSCYVQLALT